MSVNDRTFDQPESIDVPSDSIHTGFGWWLLYHQPWATSRRWTVTNGWGVVVLIVLGLLILLSQSRVWIFWRYFCWKITKFFASRSSSNTEQNNSLLTDSNETTPLNPTGVHNVMRYNAPARPETPNSSQNDDHANGHTNSPDVSAANLTAPERGNHAASRRRDHTIAQNERLPPPEKVGFIDAFNELWILAISSYSKTAAVRAVRLSRCFAVSAALTVASTLLLEFGSAYFVADSGISAASLVQSRPTTGCVESKAADGFMAIRQVAHAVDGIFGRCTRQSLVGCDDEEQLNPPNIDVKPSKYCPFASQLCREDTQSLQLTHSKITAYDVGVNSRASVATSHRLTCAPLKEELLLRHVDMDTWISMANDSMLDQPGNIARTLSLVLRTHNGPNDEYPDERSGFLAAVRDGPRDVTLLPMLDAENLAITHPDILRPDLIRLDGRPFLVVHRGGNWWYNQEIDDPFFVAHTVKPLKPAEPFLGYLSDHEATVLGCVEQYRFCSDLVDFCSEWGVKASTRLQLAAAIQREMDSLPKGSDTEDLDWEGGELLFLHTLIAGYTSVFSHLAGRVAQGLTPLRPKATLNKRVIYLFDSRKQWEIEVETWFRKAFLDAVFYARLAAQFNPDDFPADELNLCGRILLRDSDYININVVNFFIVLCLLAVVWLVLPLGRAVQSVYCWVRDRIPVRSRRTRTR